jgi:hypothetical protein
MAGIFDLELPDCRDNENEIESEDDEIEASILTKLITFFLPFNWRREQRGGVRDAFKVERVNRVGGKKPKLKLFLLMASRPERPSSLPFAHFAPDVLKANVGSVHLSTFVAFRLNVGQTNGSFRSRLPFVVLFCPPFLARAHFLYPIVPSTIAQSPLPSLPPSSQSPSSFLPVPTLRLRHSTFFHASS